MFDLQGKVAVVTGAGSGIGAAIARVFAARGAHVAVVDREEAAARQVAGEITAARGAASAHRCDVSQPAEVEALVAALAAAHPRLDILVNNAGIAHIGTVETTTPEDMDRLYRVNVFGVYLCSHAVVPLMLRQGRSMFDRSRRPEGSGLSDVQTGDMGDTRARTWVTVTSMWI